MYLYQLLFGSESKQVPNFYYLSLLKDSTGWSIHGLWPQYNKGSYPSFCKPVEFNIDKLSNIKDKLELYWHSDRGNDPHFWKHEWEKHGSCMFNNCDEFHYFNTALELYQKALDKNLPDKYFNSNKNQCLIPVNLNFEFTYT